MPGLVGPNSLCGELRRPAWESVFNILLIGATVAAYIPQYIKILNLKSSYGIDNVFVLIQAIITTQSLTAAVNYYLFPEPVNVIDCFNAGAYKGLEAVGIVAALILPVIHHVCCVTYLTLVLVYRPVSDTHTYSSRTIAIIFITWQRVFLLPGLSVLAHPNASYFPLALFQFIANWSIVWIVTAMSIYQAFPQLNLTRALGATHALSTLSLAFQALLFAALAISWSLRIWQHILGATDSQQAWIFFPVVWYRFGGWNTVHLIATSLASVLVFVHATTRVLPGTVAVNEQTPLLVE